MPRKPDRPQEVTLATLRHHAFGLFGRFGYEGVSVAEIARLAGLSKSALYWHFDGKQALYLDCLHHLHAIFREHVFEPMAHCRSGLEGAVEMFRGVLRMFGDQRVQGGIAGYWLLSDTAETAALVAVQRRFETDSRRTIEGVLGRATSEGSIDLGTELEDVARALILLIEACLLPLRDLSVEEVKSQLGLMARTLLRAYGTDPDVTRLAGQLRF